MMRLLPNLSRHSKNSPAACGEAEPLAQTERQRQATRPGPVIHGTFSPARSWRPAVVARLARSVYTLKASCSKLGCLVPVNRQHPQLAQSAGLRIGAFDDKAEFQDYEPTALKPTSTIA